MKVLIIYHSEHHQNTEKIARTMATKIESELKEAKDVNTEDINNYDIIGFGSGVYRGRLHSEISNIIDNLPYKDGKKTFIFSTTGSMTYSELAHDRFRPLLIDKGFKIIGEFSCLGFDTALTREGINKGRPDKQDLENAEKFIESILII
ncbi:MAG: flavodoxin family protein [Nitrososphaeraceae archaeon]